MIEEFSAVRVWLWQVSRWRRSSGSRLTSASSALTPADTSQGQQWRLSIIISCICWVLVCDTSSSVVTSVLMMMTCAQCQGQSRSRVLGQSSNVGDRNWSPDQQQSAPAPRPSPALQTLHFRWELWRQLHLITLKAVVFARISTGLVEGWIVSWG